MLHVYEKLLQVGWRACRTAGVRQVLLARRHGPNADSASQYTVWKRRRTLARVSESVT